MDIRAPDPPLADGNIVLRPWRLKDSKAIVGALDGEEQIFLWLDQVPQPYRAEDARQYIEGTLVGWRAGEHAAFAIVDAANDELLGSIALNVIVRKDAVAEVGYWVAASARGRGVATAALRLIATWAIETAGVERLQLRAATGNRPSQRVAERAGFRLEGVIRSAHLNERLGERVDWAMYSVVRADRT